MKFAQPLWLVAGLIACLALVWRYRRFDARQRNELAKFASASLIAQLTASVSPARRQFKRVLVVCDIEGAEKEILDPSLIPSLAVAEILVETHESKAPGIKQLLRERFSATHTIELYENRKRSAAVCPDVLRRHLSDDEAATAVWEDRGLVQHWMWMKPTNKGIEK